MPRRGLINVLILILILFCLISSSFFYTFSAEPDNASNTTITRISGRDVIYNETNNKISTHLKHKDETIYLFSNLTIENGGTLELDNCSLIMNSTGGWDFSYGIYVKSGAVLKVVNNSIIEGYDFWFYYELQFEPGSEGYFEDSTISDCGDESEEGVLIQSSNVTFKNCTFKDNYIALNCRSASPTIENCVITDSSEAAILCNNSVLKVIDCEIDESDIIVENNSTLLLVSTQINVLDPYNVIYVHDTSRAYINWWLNIKVVNETDNPLQNAHVIVTDKYDEIIYDGYSDEFGQVLKVVCVEFYKYNDNGTSKKVWFYPYNITVSLGGYITGYWEDDVFEDTPAEIILKLAPPTGNITGHVLSTAGFPINDANVSLTYDSTTIWEFTDINGSYTFSGIPPGENYKIRVVAKINDITAYEIGVNNTVTVVADETTTVNFSLLKNKLPVIVYVESWDNEINADGATDVDIDTDIKIEFGKAMNENTLEGNITLMTGILKVPGTVVIAPDDEESKTKFKYILGLNLTKETSYNFVISKDVMGLAAGTSYPVFWEDYEITFKTEIDPIKEFSPKDGAKDVNPENPNIYINFHSSIKLNQTSLETNLKVTRVGPPQLNVAGSIIIGFGNSVSFNPTSNLEGNTLYRIEVWDGLVDANGNHIIRPRSEEQVEYTFTTKEIVIPTTSITGQVFDEKKSPIEGALVVLLDPEGNEVGNMTTLSTGFFAFSGIELDKEYKIKISIEGYKTYEQTGILSTTGDIIELENITLEKEVAEDKKEKEEKPMDPMVMGGIILAIVVIIIIILIALMIMRKPKKEEYADEEEVVEERAPAPTYRAPPERMRAPTPTFIQPIREPTFRPEERRVSFTMNRCPMCGHRLTSTGECFRCNMAQRYGL